MTVTRSDYCLPSSFPTSPHSYNPATEARGALAGSLTWSAVLLELNSRHPGSQTCTNVFNGSELHSCLPEIHKLGNYGWHKTKQGPRKVRLMSTEKNSPPALFPPWPGAEASRPSSVKREASAGPEELAAVLPGCGLPPPHKPGCFLF